MITNDATSQPLVPGQVYRIHIPGSIPLTALVRAKEFSGELCTERINGHLEPVRCEAAGTYFIPVTPEECAEFQTKNRW